MIVNKPHRVEQIWFWGLEESENLMVGGYPKLAAIDLDGTLLSVDGHVPEGNRDAIRDWVRAGRHLAILTSRSPQGMRKVLSELNVPCVASGFSGGLVWRSSAPDWVNGEALIDISLSTDMVDNIWEMCRELKIPTISYTRFSTVGNIRSDAIEREVTTTGESITYSTKVALDEPIYKLNIMVSTQADGLALRSLPIPRDVSLNMTRGGNIELTSRDSSKGRALSATYVAMGVSREDTIAVGDGDNDVSMFRVAGVSMAVPGATDRARESADILLAGEGPAVVGDALLRALSWRQPGPEDYAVLGQYVRR